MRSSAFLLLLFACGEAERDPAADSADAGPEDCRVAWYFDQDGDGHGDAGVSVDSCDPVAGHVAVGDDCDDAEPGVFPGAAEECDGVDQDCDGTPDDNPDTDVDWFVDEDGDGFGAGEPTYACAAPSGLVPEAGDCDDGDARVSPAAAEECANGRDDDCDGEEDDADSTDADTFWADTDGDGYGDPSVVVTACTLPPGAASNADDCDDTAREVNPAGVERCDGVDQDCDTLVDDDATDRTTFYVDSDGDGFGDLSAPVLACDLPAGHAEDATDCDDTDASAFPGADEVCGGGDEDCDFVVDEDSAVGAATWYGDGDGDGYGDPGATTVGCEAPAGFVADFTDCDDTDPGVSPAADEVCGGPDEDCDGDVDEDGAVDATAWYTDGDGDGYGDSATATVACDAPSGTVANDGDCDDGDSAASPALAEVCNTGVDEDCDGDADEGCEIAPGSYASADAGLTILGEPDTTLGRDGILVADLDGDGVNTLIIGTIYGSDAAWSTSGSVYLFDDPGTGALDWSDADTTFSGSGDNYRMAYPVLAGDQDGDGVGDLFGVGQYSGSFDCRGGAVMLSGAVTGLEVADCSHAGRFGSSTDGRTVVGPLAAADLDDDGVEDLVGWLDDDLFVSYGPIDGWERASAADVIVNDAAVSRPSLMAGGDYDGDGHDEVVFGASDVVWRCEGISSATGPSGAGCVTAISEVSSDSWNLGYSASGLGDADGDGVQDGLLVGAPGYKSSSASSADGMVLRFTGSLVALDVSDADASWTGTSSGDALGASRVFAVGDVDADGEPDVGFTHGTLGVFLDYDVVGHSGTASDADVRLSGPTSDLFGYDANAGDLDSDGSVDLVVSAIWDTTGGIYAGAVYVLYAN